MKKITHAVSEYWASLDKWLLFFWLVASGSSVPFLWAIADYWPERYSINMQLVAIPMGLVIAFIISLWDYNTILKLWRLYVPAMLVLMILTFIVGRGRGAANQNWIDIPIGPWSFSLQPSEFLKISFITTFALHISKVKERLNDLPNIVFLILHGGLYLAIMYQDTGSMLVFVAIFVTMLFCAGVRWRYVFAGLIGVAAAVPVLWFYLLSEDQKARILVVFQPDLNADYAYQQIYGLVALSTGGRTGIGLFADKHTPVPEINNDMIFTFIGESAGFIGCFGVVAVLSAIALKIIYNSGHAKDEAGRMICVGIFAMIISQMFINIGMCLMVTPVIGITLPLYSSGGTSLLSMYTALGLALSVYRHSSVGLFTGKLN